MRPTMLQVPVALLLAPGLTAAAKLLWLAAHTHTEAPTPTSLGARTGLARITVRRLLAELEAAGWPPKPASPTAGPFVSIPPDLLPDPDVRPQAKLLYGLLQNLDTYQDSKGEFSYTTLGQSAAISAVTARACIRDLVEAGWLQIRQEHKLAPVSFTLRNPGQERSASEAAKAMERLKEADFRGEAIMREYLTLLIDTLEFEDHARPGFLTNPLTDERMELDRFYYALDLAFEFHGPQHYRTTERYPSERGLAMQQARDAIKETLCRRHGIRLVVINREDLSLKTMQKKVSQGVPLRKLSGHEALIKALEKASRAYRS